MLTKKINTSYNVKAWYWEPIYPDMTNTNSSLDWENNPISFWCKEVEHNQTALEQLQNTMSRSTDQFIETESLIEFKEQGKIGFGRIAPDRETASKIQRDGIKTKTNSDANLVGNRFRNNRYKKKVIHIG